MVWEKGPGTDLENFQQCQDWMGGIMRRDVCRPKPFRMGLLHPILSAGLPRAGIVRHALNISVP